MLDKAGDALVTGLGLKRAQVALLIRVGWVVLVSGHIAWVCGWLTFAGITTPFARASELDQLKRASNISARIALNDEIRIQVRILCTAEDQGDRTTAYRLILKLNQELEDVTGEKQPEPRCQMISASN